MNRNPDGTMLTREQVVELALEAGMPPSKVATDTKTWVFWEASRSLRFDKWSRGELLLDTRPVGCPAPTPSVDWEMVSFLTGKVPA